MIKYCSCINFYVCLGYCKLCFGSVSSSVFFQLILLVLEWGGGAKTKVRPGHHFHKGQLWLEFNSVNFIQFWWSDFQDHIYQSVLHLLTNDYIVTFGLTMKGESVKGLNLMNYWWFEHSVIIYTLWFSTYIGDNVKDYSFSPLCGEWVYTLKIL